MGVNNATTEGASNWFGYKYDSGVSNADDFKRFVHQYSPKSCFLALYIKSSLNKGALFYKFKFSIKENSGIIQIWR